MADRYTIDANKYIPLGLRPLARGLGLDDLSNLNPFTSLFSRPRDAAARYAEPEKYSPTGKRETMDLVEAAMGPAEAALGVGIGRYLTQPVKQILTSTFTGVDPDLSQADAALPQIEGPTGIETLVPPPEYLAQNELSDLPSQLELDLIRSMDRPVEEGEVPFAPLDDADDFELPDYDDVFVPDNTPTTVNNPNYREYGINLDNDLAEDVGIDIESGLIFSAADGPQSIFERANLDDFVERFRNTNDDIRGEMSREFVEGSLDLLDTYMTVEDANTVRMGILSDIGMPANDLNDIQPYVDRANLVANFADDPRGRKKYGLMDSDTPFKSKYAEVVQSLNQTKFGSAAEFLNLLRNRDVTEAELQARDLTEKSLPAGKFDLKSLTGLDEKSPLKVTILTEDKTNYKEHFTPGGSLYSETVITLDTPNPDVGLVADRIHFSSTQASAGGPTVVHLRKKLFDVVDPDDPDARPVAKAYHLGEIQSEGEKVARSFRKPRNRIKKDFGDPQKLSDFANIEAVPVPGISAKQTMLDAITDYKDLQTQNQNLKELGGPSGRFDPEILNAEYFQSISNNEAKLADLKLAIENTLDSGDYGFIETFDDALEYQGKVQNFLLEDQGTFARDESRNQVNESFAQIYGPDTADDLEIGSLYTTDKITRIALKQALDEAISFGSGGTFNEASIGDLDFLTIGTGDMAYNMTGGTLEGQRKYYDEILPKKFNKLLEELEKDNKVKLPRLTTKIIQGDNKKHTVLGLELTDELKKIFKESGVYAFKKGGEVGLRSGVMSAPGNGMVR